MCLFPSIAILDTGAGVSIISEKFYKLLNIPKKNNSLKIRSVNNDICEAKGKTEFEVKIGPKKIFVPAYILENFPYNLLIGNDVITKYKMILDF
ncbi:hypothetical protein B4U79_18775 [Dinothrombium tinctorium]|uniref:Peptidase A2 domain-containing protein n=1 Tax=Dinothrombium tinctorium TaxID=1965070 RepID=A0A3S3NHL3_9ACAR|nr:hypothetical protein B4U79_18775 [Dinothrombium tinctorium]